MDQPPAPKALPPAVQFADQGPIIAPDVSGEGEGLTGPRSFSRWRRCVMVDHFRIT